MRMRRHIGQLTVVLALVAGALAVAVVVQAVMLHARGWRVAWRTMPCSETATTRSC